jgi:UMF1 family MFS transporter
LTQVSQTIPSLSSVFPKYLSRACSTSTTVICSRRIFRLVGGNWPSLRYLVAMTNTSGKSKTRLPKTKLGQKGTFSWALWDWAQQPYPTIMQTFIFPVYLASTVAGAGSDADVQLGLTTFIAGLFLLVIAPVLGRRSDEGGRRKFWLMANTYILVVIMVASFFVEPKAEFLLFGLILYGMGSVVQESAFINYYAMLKSVSSPSTIGRISGYAWGLGYLGGIILLAVALFGFVLPEMVFGVPATDGLQVRTVFLICAVWTLVFSIPLLLNVPEIEKRKNARKESILASYVAIWGQLKSLYKQAPDTLKFLISSAVYRDGLAGVFTFGAVLGSLAFGFTQTEIIIFGMAANIVAGIGAVIGGRIDDVIGSKAIIVASLMGLIVAGLGVFIFADAGQITYWIGGLALCLFVGPAQASSRTFVSRFAPEGREGEVFGLYQTTGRAISGLSGFFWATSISIAAAVTGKENTTIYGVLGLMVILVVGLALLLRVNPNPKVSYSS